MDILNIIHLKNDENFPHRKMREIHFLEEIKKQNIKEYKVWDAIYYEDNPIKAISQSHKIIVKDAKEKGLERVIIAEDDFEFVVNGAWEYFLKSIPEKYDLFLSHIYYGKWDEEGKVQGPFAALTLYCIHNSFYDLFLKKKETEHLDLVMNNAWRHNIKVCLPMICRQINGYSDNSKEIMDWSYKEKDKPMYK